MHVIMKLEWDVVDVVADSVCNQMCNVRNVWGVLWTICQMKRSWWKKWAYYIYIRSLGSSFSVVTRLWAGCQSLIPSRGRDFSLHNCVQISSGAHSASYPLGIGVSFPWGKGWAMKLTSHLYLLLRLKMCGAIPPLLHTSSMCGA
jgi:hypothetical protein